MSLESRTNTAAVAEATSTQCPAAPLRVLFRQVKAFFCNVMPFSEVNIVGYNAQALPEAVTCSGDEFAGLCDIECPGPQIGEGIPVDLNVGGLGAQLPADQIFTVHHRGSLLPGKLKDHE